MAQGNIRLTSTRYVKPGAYIGYVRIPRPTTPYGNPRFPCVVARGHRLARSSNQQVRRAFVTDEDLTFSTVVPYIALLQHPAINDKTLSGVALYKDNREVVPSNYWDFIESISGSGVYDAVQMSSIAFDPNAVYLIDYQSNDRTRLDPMPFNDVRQMTAVGDAEGQARYVEFTDYRIVTEVVGNIAGTDNAALIAAKTNYKTTSEHDAAITYQPYGGATPFINAVQFNVASKYTHKYSEHYKIEVVNVAAGPPWDVTFEITITPQSGGNNQANKIPQHSSMLGTADSVTFTVDTTLAVSNYQLEQNYSSIMTDGIRLNFDAYNAAWAPGPVPPARANYVVGDYYEWEAYGPGRIEISSACQNDNQFSEVSTPAQVANEIVPAPDPDLFDSSGVITINPFTDYTSLFNRDYKFRVSSALAPSGDGPSGNRRFDIYWSAWKELPYTEGVIQVDEAIPTSYGKVALEEGIFVDINLGPGHMVPAIPLDGLTPKPEVIVAPVATDLATAITLAADCRTKYNYHDNSLFAALPPGRHMAGTGLHQVVAIPADLATLITFCGELQTAYNAHIIDDTMHRPIDDIWLLDDTIVPLDLATCITFLNDFSAKYRRHMLAYNFIAGDTWISYAKPARQNYTAKDDRTYNLTVGNVTGVAMLVDWYTDTYEGRFGNFTVPAADIYVDLPDSITLAVRNFPKVGLDERFKLNDKFTFSTTNEDTIDWTLRSRIIETITNDNIYQDVLGRVTGIPLSYYIILSETPETVIRVSNSSTGVLIPYELVLDTYGNPTPYIRFTGAKPTSDILVYYEHKGAEPAPGQYYYVSGNRLRADEEYEVPILYYTREDMEEGLAPKTADNHLWIAGDIQFDTSFFGGYYCQVKDAAGNQVFSMADYRRAIDATEKVRDITDLTIASYYPATAYSKASVEKMADPFVKSERMLWVGAPIGTPVGNVDTPDTLLYLARKSLQFSGDNPARGHVVLLANPRVTRSIVLDDNSVARVDLDGSYLAAFTAARNAAFINPWETLLRKDVASFEDMDVFNDAEQLLLGGASILYCNPVGAGGFRYEESVTVDTSAPDLQEISAMNQKIYVTKIIARDMDDALISVVPPSPAAGVAMIQAFLAQELQSISSSGIIAPYGSETNPPTIRPVDPSGDLFVFIDELVKTLYHFGYWYNIRYPIKRLYGLYSVDTKFWDARQ